MRCIGWLVGREDRGIRVLDGRSEVEEVGSEVEEGGCEDALVEYDHWAEGCGGGCGHWV